MEHLQNVTTEIDRLIALEVGEIKQSFSSVDDFNERRMVCKFFGHAGRSAIRKYKGVRTVYCPYCAEILAYGNRAEIIPDSASFVFEYMQEESFLHIKHPKADK